MDLLKLNIFRGSIFKQAKFLISSPPKTQRCIYLSEAGVISQEYLPVNTGFVTADSAKKAWLVLHGLKFPVLKNGEQCQEESVLLISDRSYFPLDPQGMMPQSEKNKLINLKSIAKMKHAQARNDMSKDRDPHARLTEAIVTYSFLILALIGIGAMLLKSC